METETPVSPDSARSTVQVQEDDVSKFRIPYPPSVSDQPTDNSPIKKHVRKTTRSTATPSPNVTEQQVAKKSSQKKSKHKRQKKIENASGSDHTLDKTAEEVQAETSSALLAANLYDPDQATSSPMILDTPIPNSRNVSVSSRKSVAGLTRYSTSSDEQHTDYGRSKCSPLPRRQQQTSLPSDTDDVGYTDNVGYTDGTNAIASGSSQPPSPSSSREQGYSKIYKRSVKEISNSTDIQGKRSKTVPSHLREFENNVGPLTPSPANSDGASVMDEEEAQVREEEQEGSTEGVDKQLAPDSLSTLKIAVENKIKKCLEILAPLKKPMDKRPDDKIDTTQLLNMLKAFEELWTPLDPTAPLEVILQELGLTVQLCLGLKDGTTTLPPQLEDFIDTQLQEPVWNLRIRMLQAGMIGNSSLSDSEKLEHRLATMYCKQVSACEAYYHVICYKVRNFDFQLDNQNPDITLGLLRYLPKTEVAGYENCLKFLVYCLNKCQERRYRRFRGCIYRPKYTQEGWFTNAYERKCTISEFVWASIDIGRSYHIFKAAYSKRPLAETVAKVLELFKSCYLPDLEENRYLSSWQNGVYHHGEDKFYPYGLKQTWGNGPVSQPQPTPQAVQEAITTLDKLSQDVPKWQSVFQAIKQDLDPTVQKKDQQREDDGDSAENDNLYIGATWASSIYIDMPFVPTNVSPTDQDGNPRRGYWRDIPTVILERLLSYQQFGQDTKDWLYALLGRALYTCGDLGGENWHVAVLLLGYSGTGKSTLLKLLRKFFKVENIGVLSNNIERQWAMSSLVDKDVVIGYEIGSDFKWDEHEFKQCAAAEELLVARKHKEAFISQFKSEILMAANEMIHVWRNTSDSLRRRLVVFLFKHFIKAEHVDPKMMENLEAEFPLFIQKINKAYREKVEMHSHVDIWSVLPKELLDANKTTMSQAHPLQDFLAKNIQQDKIELCPTAYCPWDEFMLVFRQWCDKEGIEHKKIRFTDDYYDAIFVNNGLKVYTGPKYDSWIGKEVKRRWIEGMCFNHTESQLTINNSSTNTNNNPQQRTYNKGR